MAELFIGAVAAMGLFLLVLMARSRAIPVRWWQWVLTVLCLIYAVFVAEIIISFLREGTPKGAVVTGTLLGFPAAVWAVLLGRFVFGRGRGKGEGGTVRRVENARNS